MPAHASRGPLRFPETFRWGVSTAAIQIEGATRADGRGRSIWDTFSERPGAVLDGDTPEHACDHYRRWPQDIALMRELGVGSYRFSIAWPRIQPQGRGPALEAGLDFYDRLVDGLLEVGIDPVATLYHWDLPQALEDEGGWAERGTAQRFAEYAHVVAGRLGDRVRQWSTLNEPWCSAFLGYCNGVHAPGRTEPAAALAAMHHLLLGHGLAVEALRSQAPDARLSIVLNLTQVHGDDPEAVRKVDGLHNRVYLDPVLLGRYPADVVEDTRHLTDWSFVREGDAATIAAPIDWLGINYYAPAHVGAAADPSEVTTGALPGLRGVVYLPPRPPLTGIGWEQDPASLTSLLLRLSHDYPGVPLVITENGAAFPDAVGPDGGVDDADRLAYIDGHLRAVHAAIEGGAPVQGYLAWSLLDNFEWAFGYSQRFGLVHVDYETQERTIKRSGHWYARVARSGELPATD
ncbi:GH1 family beta-glucosidase [Wenjunlia tyrosinilytica]|nr:GH1 family beta-glucosidase [Wenjunlia tyrosinilytica]